MISCKFNWFCFNKLSSGLSVRIISTIHLIVTLIAGISIVFAGKQWFMWHSCIFLSVWFNEALNWIDRKSSLLLFIEPLFAALIRHHQLLNFKSVCIVIELLFWNSVIIPVFCAPYVRCFNGVMWRHLMLNIMNLIRILHVNMNKLIIYLLVHLYAPYQIDCLLFIFRLFPYLDNFPPSTSNHWWLSTTRIWLWSQQLHSLLSKDTRSLYLWFHMRAWILPRS